MKNEMKAPGDNTAADAAERGLVIAYLSYALEDVRELSPTALQLLTMTIASLIEESASPNEVALPGSGRRH